MLAVRRPAVSIPATVIAVALGVTLSVAGCSGDTPPARSGSPAAAEPTQSVATPTVRVSPSVPPATTPTRSPAVAGALPSSRPSSSGAPGAALRTVSVTTTISGWDASSRTAKVAGYANVVEQGGTCTLSLTAGGTVVTATTTAHPDASTTSCGLILASDPRLTPGPWTATLTYTSSTSTGKSTPLTIEVS